MRYGIPDFKMEKSHIDRRMDQMQVEGVTFRTGVFIGLDDTAGDAEVLSAEVSSSRLLPQSAGFASNVSKAHTNIGVNNMATETIAPEKLLADFDAVVLSGGAETPRDLPMPGRELNGIYPAMDFLPQQNRVNAGDVLPQQLRATGKHVVVIGGGDTGSDCVGTSNRHGALSVTQFEVMPRPPEQENKPLVWPNWPMKLRTSSSHEEGAKRDWAVSTKAFIGSNGKVEKLLCVRVEWKDGKMLEIAGSEFEIQADLVLLAMGFVSPVQKVLDAFGVEKDARGNIKADTENYRTSKDKVFAAGDMRRGQSLIVWAIREGRQCARAVDEFLMGSSVLPR